MTNSLITSLPLAEADLAACVQCAEGCFEAVLARVEPDNPGTIRQLWNAEGYVASVLQHGTLPIERGEVLGLVEAFLVHHVLDLAVLADAHASVTQH